ncbi:NACHT domain-containing protein, partial [Streptomyces sp. NPDC023998]|uniref:NACHT domain-containing protein n=1 Tax=Streptomyces sp. NPDC023998 TaxID=3154597 RepID=UPI0033C0D35B
MVSTTGDLSAERQMLRDELRKLEGTALKGRNRIAAINEANKRRKMSQYPPLQPTTVGTWFEKGTPAMDFEDLWALVEVLLEWSGQPRPTRSGPASVKEDWENTRKLWKIRYGQAKSSRPASAPPAGISPALKGYLAAVGETAGAHPYPWSDDASGDRHVHVPDLTDVYVRQQATPQSSTDDEGPGPENTTSARTAASPGQHAGEVFRSNSSITVLLAPAGSGKSTLLRTHRADSASRWLRDGADATMPVLVNADALTTPDLLPDALAKAAAKELTRFALLEKLPADLFRHPSRPKTPWLVLVDGLDEIPNAETRRAVVQTLTETAEAHPALYRVVVATRPLPTRELDTLGPHVPRFELQPFSPQDLQTYATNWFRDLDDPARHAQAFTAGLERSRLDVLARTPLMAFLLCQLYKTDPRRSLPHGRTGVYQACVKRLYETNAHKNIRATHNEAIRHLKDRHQIHRDNVAAEQAARHVREHLPELIDYLAHARINGNAAPAVEILTSHLHVKRPQGLAEHLWGAFIGDLLRPTGLLTEQADDFHFLHQTFLEYHAARHATRNERACAELLDELFPPRRLWRWRRQAYGAAPGQVSAPEPSYLGFLLDALLASPGGIAAETTKRIQALTRQGGAPACQFLVNQVALRTNLPTEPTATQLTRFAQNKALDNLTRVDAAWGLAWVEGYRDRAAQLSAQLADDTTLDDFARLDAARGLAWVEGYRDAGANRLIVFAEDATLTDFHRVDAARGLAGVEGYRDAGANRLIAFALDTTLNDSTRLDAARDLAWVEGYRKRAAQVYARLANDTTLTDSTRLQAARDLAWVEGYRKRATQVYAQLANDTTLNDSTRLQAARDLAWVEGYEDAGADRLIALADDTTLTDFHRVDAGRGLARVEGYRDAGANRLIAFALDTTLNDSARVDAARDLAGVEGYEDAGADRLIAFALDTTLNDSARARAARGLAGVEGYRERAAQLCARLADDATLNDSTRVGAAGDLAGVEGYRDAGANRLIAFADDTTLNDSTRLQAARGLAGVKGYRDAGAGRLIAFALDTTLNDFHRVDVARDLAGVGGYRERATQLYAQLALDATLNDLYRVSAARGLAGVEGYRKRAAQVYARLANDATLNDSTRVDAARGLAGVEGYRKRAAQVYARLADDTTLNDFHRVDAARGLAGVEGYRDAGADRLIALADDTTLN